MMHSRFQCVVLLSALSLQAQQPPATTKRPLQAQSPSTFAYQLQGATESVAITNVAYQVVGPGIPGRPKEERLTLRQTTTTRQVIGDVGVVATTTVAAWPLGIDMGQRPLYSVAVSGTDAKTINNEVLVISRGLEEVEWWSIYKLATGEHLFDTYTPVVQFSPTRDVFVPRYVGLKVPADDEVDLRLKVPNVVGVLTYASGEKILREALITADDPKTATLLRSYADTTHAVAVANGRITVSISQNFPSPASTVSLSVPILRDDLDVARSQVPRGIKVAAWKR